MLVLVYLLCLSWIVLVHLLNTFFFCLLTPHEVFDCLSRTSSFKPRQCKPISRAVFLSQEAALQLCHKWTDPDSVSKYQKQGLLKNVTKHEECRTIIKLNHWMNIFNINSITGYGPLPSRVWSIERSSQSNEVPTNMVRKLQLSNAISENKRGLQVCYSHRDLQHIKLQSFYRLQLMIHDPHDCLNRRPPWPNVAFDPSDPAYLKLKEVGCGGVQKDTEFHKCCFWLEFSFSHCFLHTSDYDASSIQVCAS